jgi:hypothetical protein
MEVIEHDTCGQHTCCGKPRSSMLSPSCRLPLGKHDVPVI